MPEIPITSQADLLKKLRSQFPHIEQFSVDSIEQYNEGLGLLESKKYYKAKQTFKVLILSCPDDFIGYEGLALVYKAQGKTAEALFLIVETIRLAQPHIENGSMDIEVMEEFQAIKEELETPQK
jgi:tetratricopeptide (TPR) repeat protein